MKLVIDIPEDSLNRIREIVEIGDYDDPNEFVLLALENQIQLETSSNIHGDGVQMINDYFDGDHSDGSKSPQYAELENHDFAEINPSSPPNSDRLENGPLWGQYNRIFPVKVVVRRLANALMQENTDYLDLEEFHEIAAIDARNIGSQLKRIDKELERGQGEKFSSGLPVASKKEKSLDRFKEQFIGEINKKGELRGASPSLQFVNITPDREIGLTEAGIRFAELHNSLLDESLRSELALSDDEQEFYLRHVADEIPAEFEAMALVARNIQEGINRPQSLTGQLSDLNANWSESQRNTIRIGLISRMYELNLLKREQVGQRGIAYRLTADGEQFLSGEVVSHE